MGKRVLAILSKPFAKVGLLLILLLQDRGSPPAGFHSTGARRTRVG
jgi:hypothetical protein